MLKLGYQSVGLRVASGLIAVLIVLGLWPFAIAEAGQSPVPVRVAPPVPDAAEVLLPDAVHIDGWLGKRIDANVTNRLLQVDTVPLLAGFHQRPGEMAWIGEHIGKWIHAATLAWVYSGNPELRAKLDRVVAELISCQEPDGYLGTYVAEMRFGTERGTDWDVWVHNYNLVGLLTYYQYTGNEAALAACRKIADLLINTYGPGKKSILTGGPHVGMAATVVLEPMVLLYRLTGDERYLGFARYIVKAWNEPDGPKIIPTLLSVKRVDKTANGKAYELVANLVGLCELARATGERQWLDPVLNAWTDIATKRLYITGSASQGEYFHDDYILPNGELKYPAECCLTVSWIQLSLQLLQFTGEAKYADELERTIYNQLAAAQRPDGAQWCYFTPLEGRKRYSPGISCCVSSGPRGMALATQTAYLKTRLDGADALAVSTFETSRATVELGGVKVTVEQQSEFPRKGSSSLTIKTGRPATFALQVRVPDWAAPVALRLNGTPANTSLRDGWLALPVREWKDGDRMEIQFNLGANVVLASQDRERLEIRSSNRADNVPAGKGLAVLRWGPFILACDGNKSPGLPVPSALGFIEFAKPPFVRLAGDNLTFEAKVRSSRQAGPLAATFVPFADAGVDGGLYQVWLKAPDTDWTTNTSLLLDGEETRSQKGIIAGSINDGDPVSFAMTRPKRPGKPDQEAWFAVTLPKPERIASVVFTQGDLWPEGGWFDTSTGKPVVQIQRGQGGDWERVGELADYPTTTVTDTSGLRQGQAFTLRLSTPAEVWAVRVIGKPAYGDTPKQAFVACAELEAFAD